MTQWIALSPELQQLFNDVTCGPGSKWAPILREAIQAPFDNIDKGHFYTHCVLKGLKCWEGFAESCWDFVHYQVMDKRMCNGDIKLFEKEGFQIGSPWHGDVMEAPILFLSDNPGVTQRCLFPRWHPKTNSFTLGGNNVGAQITYTDDNGTPTSCQNSITPGQGIYDFFANRFQTLFITRNGNPNAWIIKSNDTCGTKRGGVLFWRRMREFMEELIKNTNNTPKPRHTRGLMNSVLSAEIIPFGSQNQSGANDTEILDYYWDNFVSVLLKHCGAKILILVGDNVRECFLQSLKRNYNIQSPQLNTGTLYDNNQNQPYRNKNGDTYRVAAINHLAYRFGPQNYLTVAQLLNNESSNEPGGVVAAALKKAKALY